MSAVRQHSAALQRRSAVPADEPQALPADIAANAADAVDAANAANAANDDTALPSRTFDLGKDPLFGMAIATVILFAIFAALMASF